MHVVRPRALIVVLALCPSPQTAFDYVACMTYLDYVYPEFDCAWVWAELDLRREGRVDPTAFTKIIKRLAGLPDDYDPEKELPDPSSMAAPAAPAVPEAGKADEFKAGRTSAEIAGTVIQLRRLDWKVARALLKTLPASSNTLRTTFIWFWDFVETRVLHGFAPRPETKRAETKLSAGLGGLPPRPTTALKVPLVAPLALDQPDVNAVVRLREPSPLVDSGFAVRCRCLLSTASHLRCSAWPWRQTKFPTPRRSGWECSAEPATRSLARCCTRCCRLSRCPSMSTR